MEAAEYFQFTSSSSSEPKSEHFMVEDLLDLSHHDDDNDAIIAHDSLPADDSSSFLINSLHSSSNNNNFSPHFPLRNLPDPYFSPDLCLPSDDMAELEWLSNIGEESFSSEDLQKLELISGIKVKNEEASESRDEFQQHEEANRNDALFKRQVSVPAKARSKRSRGPPCKWTSRLVALSPTTSSSSDADVILPGKKSCGRRKENGGDEGPGGGRRCLHCATDKTPQWRTGPMGPKTLCNACGVRYKSGRLVPEYRPAASPTFVLTKHSNSHRKVMELRRQKEMMRAHQEQQQHMFLHHHHQNLMLDVSSNGDDYLIHQHVGPDIRHLI